jgi:hypothetical protein
MKMNMLMTTTPIQEGKRRDGELVDHQSSHGMVKMVSFEGYLIYIFCFINCSLFKFILDSLDVVRQLLPNRMHMLPGENIDWHLIRMRILKHPEWKQKFHAKHIASTEALRGCEDALYTSLRNADFITADQQQMLEFSMSRKKFKGQRKMEPFDDWNNGKAVHFFLQLRLNFTDYTRTIIIYDLR